MNQIKTIAIFCGANEGNDPIYQDKAMTLINLLAEHNITLIYGGGNVGLMGTIANRMLELNAQVIGVMPQSLVDAEIAHQQLTELHIVDSMPERKNLISQLADGFILLPGGSGSLDEFFEVWTTAQLGEHKKPCGIFNINGYYDHLIKFLNHAVDQEFLAENRYNMLTIENDPKKLLTAFFHYQAPEKSKWEN